MNDKDQKLFAELIQSSRVLVTSCNIAAKVLSEEFEDMVKGPMANVKAVLDRCPEGGIAWDGSFNRSDVEITEFDVGVPSMQGLRLKHKFSGKSVEVSHPVGDSLARKNNTINQAMDALQAMVIRYVDRQREIGAL